ncbi:MAG: hypothetical protein PHQ35_09375 [Phycisphaerae bacterium]|nr:hypothetical protein [Phycisphaerae bacterium]MDD5239927.1 hypothetical protein [Candidatus Nanoarchaeia archaeon]
MLPEKVKIGGFTWPVVYEDNLQSLRERAGEARFIDQVIAMSKTNTSERKQEVFIHEILEIIKHLYEIKLDHDNLSRIAVVLHQIIKDNPGIFDFKEVADV